MSHADICWAVEKFNKCFQCQLASDMPKLLFIGIIERTCRSTVIREIPDITDCFQNKEEGKKGDEAVVKVSLISRQHLAIVYS